MTIGCFIVVVVVVEGGGGGGGGGRKSRSLERLYTQLKGRQSMFQSRYCLGRE